MQYLRMTGDETIEIAEMKKCEKIRGNFMTIHLKTR